MISKEMPAENQVNHQEFEHRTKRIVSNSFMLFLRIFFITIINLYSVKYVLKGLGIDDYGVYNAVSGIVLTSSFVILVLSTSIQRFYSFAFGKKDQSLIANLFSASCNIIILLSFVILLLLETIGLWYVNCKLNVPIDRIDAVNYVYQFATLAFIFTLLLVPFTAIIFSHEDMGIYAALSCVDYGFRFIVAVLIAVSPIDRLVFYSAGLLVIAVIMFLSYALITPLKYKECRYKFIKDKQIYKDLLSFSGWTMYGALAGTGMIQGSILILNSFFGTFANAAFAVANQLYNAFSSLSNSIVLSFRPAMIRAYAEDNSKYLQGLFYLNNKVILYLTACVAIPFFFEMEFILTHWLSEITPEMVIYSQLFIVYAVLIVMHNPITTMVQSTGKIKKYQLLVQTITLLSLPLAIILFELNFPSYYMFISIIVCCVVAHVFRLYCLKGLFVEFSVLKYLKTIILPGIIIVSLTSLAVWLQYCNISNEIVRFFSICISSPMLVLLLAFGLGLSNYERKTLVNFIKKKTNGRWHT